MKSGFAVLVGRSNTGKSTLLNALVGTKIAITSPKPQTTRHQIHGVVHDPRGQIVFVDTPGVFERARDTLTKHLNKTASAALAGVDVILYVVDPTRAVGNEEHLIARMLRNAHAPIILVVNKCDERNRPFEHEYPLLDLNFRAVISVSGLRRTHLAPLIDLIFENLPEAEPYYPEYQVTSLDHQFWISELIREKIFIQMGAEIPYAAAVEIRSIEDRKGAEPPMRVVEAVILTANPRHKSMLIGSGGHKIKEIGAAARRELEAVLGMKVYLDLTVEVDPRWPSRMTATPGA